MTLSTPICSLLYRAYGLSAFTEQPAPRPQAGMAAAGSTTTTMPAA